MARDTDADANENMVGSMGIPPKGWYRKENPMKMDDDWGYLYFRKPPYDATSMTMID